MNALVINSREIDGQEHLTLVYLNAEVNGQMLTAYNSDKAAKIDMDVPPMVESKNRGWGDDEPASDSEAPKDEAKAE